MPDISYVPAQKAGWAVLSHGNTVLAIDLAVASPKLATLWNLVSNDTAPGAILDEIIRDGISSAPAFALIEARDPASMTVLVRGSSVLRVAGRTQLREINGEGVSSWSEQVVDGTVGFDLWPASTPEKANTLPLRSGVVWASALRCGSVDAPSSDDVAPQVEAPPAPKPVPVREKPPVQDVEETLASQTTTALPQELEEAVVEPEAPSDGSSYDHLFGETVFRNVEDAAVRIDGDGVAENTGKTVGPPPPSPPSDEGDHDGHTVMVSDMAALRAKRRAARGATAVADATAPKLYLELSTGGTEQLDQPLVIGRAPSASRVPGGKVPRLVSMNTPNQDISRTHAQVTAEGGTVVVTDLHSSNGTMITLPGKPSQKLRPGEPATVIVGTVIDLGDGATLTVCESA